MFHYIYHFRRCYNKLFLWKMLDITSYQICRFLGQCYFIKNHIFSIRHINFTMNSILKKPCLSDYIQKWKYQVLWQFEFTTSQNFQVFFQYFFVINRYNPSFQQIIQYQSGRRIRADTITLVSMTAYIFIYTCCFWPCWFPRLFHPKSRFPVLPPSLVYVTVRRCFSPFPVIRHYLGDCFQWQTECFLSWPLFLRKCWMRC